jgi:hypothetical protein
MDLNKIQNKACSLEEEYRLIANGTYTKKELIGLKCYETITGHYLMESTHSGISLIFEEKKDDLWRITNECRYRMFGAGIDEISQQDLEIVKRERKEATFYYQAKENQRRDEEKRLGLKPGSLIRDISNSN